LLLDRTLAQLAPLQIDFSSTAQIKETLLFVDLQGTIYKQGIIFVGHGIEKGPALIAYLKRLNKNPKRIVVIDDKLSNIENIAKTLEPLGIDFVGIRYSGVDDKVKAFNPKIADLQWEHFKRILSDEEALQLLTQGSNS
jgi:hypothetical protein